MIQNREDVSTWNSDLQPVFYHVMPMQEGMHFFRIGMDSRLRSNEGATNAVFGNFELRNADSHGRDVPAVQEKKKVRIPEGWG